MFKVTTVFVRARLAILIKGIHVWQSNRRRAACAKVASPVPRRVPPSSSPLLGDALVRNGKVNGAESCDAFFFLFYYSFSDLGRRSEEKGPTPRWAQAQPGVEQSHQRPFGRQPAVPAAGHGGPFLPHPFKEALYKKKILGATSTGRGKCS